MTAMVALAANMQVQMLMAGVAIPMAMFMGVKLEAEGGAHSQAAHHQQSDTHQKLCPR